MLAAALYVPSLSVYGAELFPTRSRAAAFGGAWTFNRAGAALAPILLLPLLHTAGAMALMAVVTVSLLLSLGLLWVAPAGAAKRPIS
jgi:putative MFS transporter